MFTKISRKSAEVLYDAFIRSLLEYSDVLLCNAAQDSLELLNQVHKRTDRIVSGVTRGTSSESIFSELGGETLETRRNNRMMLLYTDIMHGRAPQYLKDHVPETVKDRTRGTYALRNNSKPFPSGH